MTDFQWLNHWNPAQGRESPKNEMRPRTPHSALLLVLCLEDYTNFGYFSIITTMKSMFFANRRLPIAALAANPPAPTPDHVQQDR